MGWTRNVLRVNLTEGTCEKEPLNMEWAQAYLGQRGLASKYLVEEVEPRVEPLSPANKLIMVTGPLTGTMASTGGRYSVVTKSPSPAPSPARTPAASSARRSRMPAGT